MSADGPGPAALARGRSKGPSQGPFVHGPGRVLAFVMAMAAATAMTLAGARARAKASRPSSGGDAPGRPSTNGRYTVVLRPAKVPIPVNEWVDFSIQIRRRDGAKVELTEVALDGGMPAHGHGLPTAPTVLRAGAAGELVATGVRFNMAGLWELRLTVVDSGGGDVAVFTFDVGPQAAASAAPAGAAGPGGSGRSGGVAESAGSAGSGGPAAADATGTSGAIDPARLRHAWSDEQRATLRSLWLQRLGAPPPDPTNRIADEPRAVALGHRLFFDRGLSGNGEIACATCHQPKRFFTDGRATGRGVGSLERNTPSLVGVGYMRWLFWDGRRDSAWAQALDPIEAPTEMGGNRLEVLRHIARHPAYHGEYRALFGPLPDLDGLPRRASPVGSDAEQTAWRALPGARQEALTRAFVNVGKVIAAYERRLLPGASPFDSYVEALEKGDQDAAARALAPAAVGGLRLFLSKDTQCLRCHNGPLFTNGGFHNIGTGILDGPHPDFGRMMGIQAILATDLTCLGPYSDDPKRHCPELRFLNRHDGGSFAGAYRVPSLRNVAQTAPYMHDGRFASLDAVIRHYQKPGPTASTTEFRPLADMTSDHVAALVAFLEALSGRIQTPPELLRPPQLPAARGRPVAAARASR